MKATYKVVLLLLLAVLGLSLVTAQENQSELEPGLAMYIGREPAIIRADADRGAQRLGPVWPGTVLTVIEARNDGWVHVEQGDLNGWLRNPELVNVTEEDLLDPDDPLPPPTGPYQVGQIYRHWVDESRDELHTEDPDDHRELMIGIWYPADVPEGTARAVYWESLSGPGADAWAEILQSTPAAQALSRIAELKSHAFRDVPLVEPEAPFPVIIMSHGYPGSIDSYSLQATELASHGYVVVGINHTFYAGVTVFPDGRVIPFRPTATAPEIEQSQITGAQDVSFVISQLEGLNTDEPLGMFAGRLDLSRIGMVGHSYGGEVSVVAASMDDRIRAIVNEEGLRGLSSIPPLQQPLLFFSVIDLLIPSEGDNYTARVVDFDHNSFADWTTYLTSIGKVIPSRSVKIVRAYVLAFFDQYLKGIEQPLLDGPSEEFPEVEFYINHSEQ